MNIRCPIIAGWLVSQGLAAPQAVEATETVRTTVLYAGFLLHFLGKSVPIGLGPNARVQGISGKIGASGGPDSRFDCSANDRRWSNIISGLSCGRRCRTALVFTS